ncbi:hypothetical protein G6F59_017910 [Rhizopus arrhizus]|nr:hypothetical protein G6F59_017910 [Rhizopus arrhizus]
MAADQGPRRLCAPRTRIQRGRRNARQRGAFAQEDAGESASASGAQGGQGDIQRGRGGIARPGSRAAGVVETATGHPGGRYTAGLGRLAL